jgi:hypothetical protein
LRAPIRRDEGVLHGILRVVVLEDPACHGRRRAPSCAISSNARIALAQPASQVGLAWSREPSSGHLGSRPSDEIVTLFSRLSRPWRSPWHSAFWARGPREHRRANGWKPTDSEVSRRRRVSCTRRYHGLLAVRPRRQAGDVSFDAWLGPTPARSTSPPIATHLTSSIRMACGGSINFNPIRGRRGAGVCTRTSICCDDADATRDTARVARGGLPDS